jgi:hypothetical protein
MEEFPDHLVERIVTCFSESVDNPDDVLNLMLVNTRLNRMMRKTSTYREFQKDRMIELLSARLILEQLWCMTHHSVSYGNYTLIEVPSFQYVASLWNQVSYTTFKLETQESASSNSTCRSWVCCDTLRDMAGLEGCDNIDMYVVCNHIGQKLLHVIGSDLFAPVLPDESVFEKGVSCHCLEYGLPQRCTSYTCMVTSLVWTLIMSSTKHIASRALEYYGSAPSHEFYLRPLRFKRFTSSSWTGL